jgi:hypothetical protein
MPSYGLDISRWTTDNFYPGLVDSQGRKVGGVLTADLVRGWRDAGFHHVMIGTNWPQIARVQLEECTKGGMTVDLYHWLYWGEDTAALVKAGVALAQGYPVGMHWLDAEDPRGGFTQAQIVKKIGDSVDVVTAAGGRPGIYTRRPWWVDETGNSQAFKHLPLWHAQYIKQEPGDATEAERIAFRQSRPFQPYGGWNEPAIWQYAGSVKALNANIDKNEIYMDLGAREQEEELFTRFVATAVSPDPQFRWNGAVIQDAGFMTARADFKLPPAAKRIRLEVFLKSGRLEVLDGGPGKEYAGQCGFPASPAPSYQQIDVNLGADGNINFRGDKAVIDQLRVVGYW